MADVLMVEMKIICCFEKKKKIFLKTNILRTRNITIPRGII